MMTFYRILVGLFFLLPTRVFAQHWTPPVPLVPNASISELALGRYNDSLKTYVIEYNPDSALQAGPFVTSYFQAHEYGHIHRTHLSKNKLNQSGPTRLQLSNEMENWADIYACQILFNQDRSIILAMIHYLENTSKEDLTNLPRAERIKLLKEMFDYFTARENITMVQCTHKAHRNDSFPCAHFASDGKTLHSEDPIPCTHQAHPDGDVAPGSAPVKFPYIKKSKKVAKK